MHTPTPPKLYGLMAEFDSVQALMGAVHKARAAGYTKMDAYSPFPIHGLAEAMGFRHTRVPITMFIGGAVGVTVGYLLQWVTAYLVYPLNIGGRPFNSWILFIPVTWECLVLFSALFGFVGMLAMNGLPMPYHPVFNVPSFERASRDRFFLCLEAADPRFSPEAAREFLTGLHPHHVSEVTP